ncbi:MAG: PF20097 family protein [Candidatus Bathyarchaeota archaeon]|nr:PF20097 family protein [Candidatus Bathyarchaeota archaeon]
MSESKAKKCPRCGSEMEKGDCLFGYALSVKLQYFSKEKELLQDSVIPFYCTNCGYLELYRAMKEKKE